MHTTFRSHAAGHKISPRLTDCSVLFLHSRQIAQELADFSAENQTASVSGIVGHTALSHRPCTSGCVGPCSSQVLFTSTRCGLWFAYPVVYGHRIVSRTKVTDALIQTALQRHPISESELHKGTQKQTYSLFYLLEPFFLPMKNSDNRLTVYRSSRPDVRRGDWKSDRSL